MRGTRPAGGVDAGLDGAGGFGDKGSDRVVGRRKGVPNTEIADRTGTSRPTVLKWRGRYEQSGVDGLDDDPRRGRAPVIDEVAVLAETLAGQG